jgi:hypothetical protein
MAILRNYDSALLPVPPLAQTHNVHTRDLKEPTEADAL